MLSESMVMVKWSTLGNHITWEIISEKNKNAVAVRGEGCIPACTGWGVSQHALGRGCIPACTRQAGVCPWWVSDWGVSAQEGVCLRGVSAAPPRQTPAPCERNHRHLWNHNLAATTQLRKNGLGSRVSLGADPGFPVGGGADNFAKISEKLHEIKKILGQSEGAS